MTASRRLRLWTRRLGVDVSRYPNSDPYFPVLQRLQTDDAAVLDVGANDGGFAGSLRTMGFDGPIHSFEPILETFQRLKARAQPDTAWHVYPEALGDNSEARVINVAGNAGASSSFLEMDDRHSTAAPSADFVRTEEVQVRRLDDHPVLNTSSQRLFVKIDVQGFEEHVLNGGWETISSDRTIGLQLEVSFVKLYSEGLTWERANELARSVGMSLMSILPGFQDQATHELLQADLVFVR